MKTICKIISSIICVYSLLFYTQCVKDKYEVTSAIVQFSPDLVIKINPPHGATTQKYYISAEDSSDPVHDKENLSVTYDFNNDFKWDTELIPIDSTVSFSFVEPGNYTIRVGLFNPDSYFTTSIIDLIIEDCPNTIIDPRDGKEYSMVSIGEQCWMRQNLQHGLLIDSKQTPSQNSIAEVFTYQDDPQNLTVYGGLYLWSEIFDFSSDNQTDICPEGFRVPTDDDFIQLESYYGLHSDSLYRLGWRGAGVGESFKDSGPEGFNVLLSGQFHNGSYFYKNEYEYLWTSTLVNGNPIRRNLGKNRNQIARFIDSQNSGASIRCIRH